MKADDFFAEADRIIIAAVDTAIEVGVGRTFETPAGQTVRVTALEDVWVEMEVMVNGLPTGERLSLPRDIRRIAIATTQYRKQLEAERRG